MWASDATTRSLGFASAASVCTSTQRSTVGFFVISLTSLSKTVPLPQRLRPILKSGSSLGVAVPNCHLVIQNTENSWEMRFLTHRFPGSVTPRLMPKWPLP